MEVGSSSKSHEKAVKQSIARKFGSMLPKMEPFRPKYDHNPKELRSWAKRTGFVSTASSETSASFSERIDSAPFDLEKGSNLRNGAGSPKIEIDPVLGRTKPNRNEIELAVGSARVFGDKNGNRKVEEESSVGGNRKVWEESSVGAKVEGMKLGRNGNGNGSGQGNINGNDGNLDGFVVASTAAQPKREGENGEGVEEVYLNLDGEGTAQGGFHGPSRLKLGVVDSPGFAPLIYYGIQHCLSLAGSLIFIPLIIVPAMGGTDKDTATVISTMLMVSGISTILHSYFGTRLPLVQGSSFVYLAPALVIMNAQEYRNLNEHKFRHIMRELQGAIIFGSIFQCLLGFSGSMSLLLRWINPVVVAPTVAAIGLAFFSYGFPQAGTCVEISIPQILLVLIFTLYLRRISIFGHRLFQVYAVPLSVVIIWTYAFSLTAGGAYDYKGCSPNVPSSNLLTEECRKHTYTMEHCRTDVSNAWRTTEWVRIPYPLQWGFPIFNFRTSLIMIVTSLVATVDSVGTYHSAFVRVTTIPPTPGIVSRGIALEGVCSILAGLWGTGTGSTTLTENVHTINVTKVASRRAVEVGALFMILFSFIGKLGAILASIPLALAAAVLCFMWALTVALGLLTLQYTQTASFRNITIVGVSLFLGFSIPAYFQQYQPESSLILPGYFLPYAAASNGPFHTGNKQVDFVFNALMSLNMVVTLLAAFVLDNTVPGSRQERGVYIWSNIEDTVTVPNPLADFTLPRRVSWICCRAKCLGG